jgi:cytochrome P450
MMTSARIELTRLDDDFFADPHRQYALLRAEQPVARVAHPSGWNFWLITRYDDVRAALTEPKLHKNGREFEALIGREGTIFTADFDRQMLSTDPPDHTRLRKLVSKAFTGRAIAKLRPRIEEITSGLLDAMDAGPLRVDLMEALAVPLPITVICELLGIPAADREKFRHWTNVLFDAKRGESYGDAQRAMGEYLSDLVDTKLAHPRDDMLSAIVKATENADRLTREEALGTAFLLLIAGHETTVNLIGNGTLALLNHPDQLAQLKADPALVPGAVEELLRYNSPLHLTTLRFTAEPTTLGGVEIPAGKVVLVSLAAANHDSEHYADPDSLDIRREASHLAFGHGIHYCLGAPLARLEGEIAFTRLLERFPNLALDADPAELVWRPSMLFRGLEALPVRVR